MVNQEEWTQVVENHGPPRFRSHSKVFCRSLQKLILVAKSFTSQITLIFYNTLFLGLPLEFSISSLLAMFLTLMSVAVSGETDLTVLTLALDERESLEEVFFNLEALIPSFPDEIVPLSDKPPFAGFKFSRNDSLF